MGGEVVQHWDTSVLQVAKISFSFNIPEYQASRQLTFGDRIVCPEKQLIWDK